VRRTPNLLLPVAALFSVGALLVARQNGDVKITIHPVGGNVSYIEGSGGNIGLSVGSDGVFLVDAQFEALAPRIEQAIEDLSGKKPVFLINTHWHGDHTGGNPFFAKTATIVAQENVRRRLAKDETIGGRVVDVVRAEGLPDVTFADGLSLYFNGEEIRVFHLPNGHTDGDSVVWFKGSNVVHMGDLYFSETYPFIDLNSGGSVTGYLAALEAVLAEIPADAKIIAGHGRSTGIEGLRAFRDMIDVLSTRVREALAAGMSPAEMIEGKLSEDYDARWGGSSFVPPERFVQMMSTDLSR